MDFSSEKCFSTCSYGRYLDNLSSDGNRYPLRALDCPTYCKNSSFSEVPVGLVVSVNTKQEASLAAIGAGEVF